MSCNEKRISSLLDEVRAKRPLVHCITNYVTVNDCANALLAIGGAPVMADAIEEAEDIASISNALVINIGTLNERTIASMRAAGARANARGIPVVLDPVGAGASAYRTDTALSLLRDIRFSAIRGNLSEITTLSRGSGNTRGVDAGADDLGDEAIERAVAISRSLSVSTGAVIAISGEVDAISSGSETVLVKNGHPMMARITGTGCMLTALLGAFLGGAETTAHGQERDNARMHAVVAAVSAMCIAGERAAKFALSTGSGTLSFRNALIDALSLMDSADLVREMNVENRA